MMSAICSTIGTTLLWRAAARSGERGTGKTPPWLEASVFRLRWGGRSGKIELAWNDRITEPVPPSVGALVFLGFLSSSSTSKKIQSIPCRKNCRHSSVSGRTELAEVLTDLGE